jgi:hypothetical protein
MKTRYLKATRRNKMNTKMVSTQGTKRWRYLDCYETNGNAKCVEIEDHKELVQDLRLCPLSLNHMVVRIHECMDNHEGVVLSSQERFLLIEKRQRGKLPYKKGSFRIQSPIKKGDISKRRYNFKAMVK